MAKRRRASRKRYTKRQRAEILATANQEGLTATHVQQRFGVIPVTYYSWRKKAAAEQRSGGPARRGDAPEVGVRSRVRAQLERNLPVIVDQELNRLLQRMFNPQRAPRRRRR